VQPVQPIIVRVVEQPAKELSFGQIIAQALGLTGIILVVSLLLGLVAAGFFIWLRRRASRDRLDGEPGDQIKLRLERTRPSSSQQSQAIHPA